MKALIITLVALFSLVHSQTTFTFSKGNLAPTFAKHTAWTANFICSAPQFGSGIFTGKIKYDWSIRAFEIAFDGPEQYTEFYQFNVDRGYNPAVSTGQFAFQYLYKRSTSCPCETTGLNFAMPPLFNFLQSDNTPSTVALTSAYSSLLYWTNAINGDTTLDPKVLPSTKYTANNGFFIAANPPKYFILSSFFWLRNGVPAGFNINDFQRRTFALTDVIEATPGTVPLVAPKTGCKCGKQLDIVLSLDRSGSIDTTQWGLEYQFVKNLANAFQYGPLLANMGIGNWNAAQWQTLALTSGTSSSVVSNAVSSMTCCPGTTAPSCCCCGTPIGGGIWLGGQMLATSPRGKAQKILILLTDGCQNHLWVPASSGAPFQGAAVKCACGSESACAADPTCVGDITTWYNWVEQNVPGTRIIVVGVGGAGTICKDQLLLAAGGDSTNVFNPQDWNQLQTLVESISATACTADNTPCPGCCGLCTCGLCIPPNQCRDANNCSKGVLNNGTQCCGFEDVICPPKPCKFEVCEPTLGGCIYQDKRCNPTEQCIQYACNTSSNYCEASKILVNGVPPSGCATVVPCSCTNNSACDDRNNCTTDVCTNCKCTNTQIQCPASDECNLRTCKSKEGGCVSIPRVPCNDNDNCTIDSCNPKVLGGCVYTNRTCPPPKDSCTLVKCDKKDGCVYYPRDCAVELAKVARAQNCSTPVCNVTRGCYWSNETCVVPLPTSSEGVPTTVVLASVLTTAAVAGIVIGAVLLAAGLGGGAAVAIAQVAGGGGAVVTASNPLYAGTGTASDNPLNRA
jgi:hypothetical protein